jgi:high-affinity iron transporter
MKTAVTPFLLSAALGLAACGDDSDEKTETAAADTAQSALKELGETRQGLESALDAYRSGDKAAAEEAVSEAYLQHFEHVEGPLEAKDGELTEELEEGIREHLRDEVKSSKPAAEVEAAFEEIYAEMDKAEALLR